MDRTTLDRPRLFIVDTDRAAARALRHVLEPDFEIAVFDDAERLLRALERGFLPDAVLCEQDLHLVYGDDLVREIARRYPAVARHTVLTTSGDLDDVADDVRARLAGRVVQKPSPLDALRSLLLAIAYAAAAPVARTA
jgi:DNA-binding NtrC family response regulator